MRNIAKTFIIGTLIVVALAPGMHKPDAKSRFLLDLADKLQLV